MQPSPSGRAGNDHLGHTMSAQPEDLTNYRLGMIEKTLQSIAESLDRLATLEAQHSQTRETLARFFAAIEKSDERVARIEREMPTLKLIRGWVISGVISLIGLVALMIAKLFVINVA